MEARRQALKVSKSKKGIKGFDLIKSPSYDVQKVGPMKGNPIVKGEHGTEIVFDTAMEQKNKVGTASKMKSTFNQTLQYDFHTEETVSQKKRTTIDFIKQSERELEKTLNRTLQSPLSITGKTTSMAGTTFETGITRNMNKLQQNSTDDKSATFE